MTKSQLSPRIAVYPGSFDPITLGHLNVMERASQLFDRLIVGVGVNVEKETLFTPEERHAMIHEATAHLENVEIRTFSGLAVLFVRQCGARIMVRGVRPITDIAAELTMMMANRRLAPDVETLFMIADGDFSARLQFADQADRLGGGRRGTWQVLAAQRRSCFAHGSGTKSASSRWGKLGRKRGQAPSPQKLFCGAALDRGDGASPHFRPPTYAL